MRSKDNAQCVGPTCWRQGTLAAQTNLSGATLTDSDDQAITTTGGWNRRTVLKGAAAGTVLWAVPSVTSLSSRAVAASARAGCGCPAHGEATCEGQTVLECPDTPAVYTCFCWERAEGGRVCGSFAGNSTCNTDAECGPGYACVVCSGDYCSCGATGRACTPICDGCNAPQAVRKHASAHSPTAGSSPPRR